MSAALAPAVAALPASSLTPSRQLQQPRAAAARPVQQRRRALRVAAEAGNGSGGATSPVIGAPQQQHVIRVRWGMGQPATSRYLQQWGSCVKQVPLPGSACALCSQAVANAAPAACLAVQMVNLVQMYFDTLLTAGDVSILDQVLDQNVSRVRGPAARKRWGDRAPRLWSRCPLRMNLPPPSPPCPLQISHKDMVRRLLCLLYPCPALSAPPCDPQSSAILRDDNPSCLPHRLGSAEACFPVSSCLRLACPVWPSLRPTRWLRGRGGPTNTVGVPMRATLQGVSASTFRRCPACLALAARRCATSAAWA